MPEPLTPQVPPPSSEQVIVGPAPAPGRTSRIDLVSEYELDDDGQFGDANPDPLAVASASGRKVESPKVEGPKPAAQTPPPKPQHSPLVRRMAKELQVSDEDLDVATPEEAERLLAALHEQRAATKLSNQIERSPTPSPAGAGGQVPVPAPQQQQEARPAPEGYDLGISEDEFDPALVSALKKMAAHFAGQLTELKQGLGSLSQIESRRQAQTTLEQIDAGFADLGAEFHGLTGRGGRGELREGDPALDMRMAVLTSLQRRPIEGKPLREAVAIRSREMFAGLLGVNVLGLMEGAKPSEPAPAKPTRRPVQHPVTGQFTGEYEDVPSPEDRQRQDAWARAGLARPTSRQHPEEPKGPRRAAKAVAAIQEANGFGEYAPTSGDEETDLPD